tara:strand:+ start:655 stop:1449 length:795 start_codon:yes stop_codon:yes gene_type:complete
MNNSYRILKLKSGEELITRIRGQKGSKMIIERPMIFQSSTLTDPYGRTKEVTILKNWLSYASQEQTSIPLDFVATFLEPDNDVLKLYDYEKRKDDHFKKQNKNKIVKSKNNQKISKENESFEDSDDIESLVNFINQIKKGNEKNFLDKIMEDINNMDKKDLEELQNQAYDERTDMHDKYPNESDYSHFITMTLFLPPDALMSFVENGLIEEEDVRNIINGLNNKINNDNLDYLENRDPEEYGNDYRDWSPYLSDYIIKKDDDDT